MKSNEELKQETENAIKNLVSDLLYYDRKEDEDLSVEQIEGVFKENVMTVDEAVEIFRNELIKNL